MSHRLALTMIVKNEAATLATCLDSVQDFLAEIVVVDTGSSDATRDIAARYDAKVIDFAWPDSFAAARNESLRHATAPWLLWLDADEYFDPANRDKLRSLLDNLPDDNTAFVMQQRSAAAHGASATLVGQVRLFRNHPDIRWDYRVHEQILPSLRKAGHAVRFTDLVIEHTGYQDPALRRRKLERNLRLLHLDVADRPNDPFTLFNLGWVFADLGRCGEAVPLLQHSLRHSRPADSITPKLYVLLAQCHRRLGQHEQAWAACQAGNVRCPDDAELRFLKGQLCHERGDRAAARACWTQLLPTSPLTFNPSSPSRGERGASENVADYDGVFSSVDAGLRGHLVRHHLAVLAREEGNRDEAEKHWQAALAETPSFSPAHLGLAELYLQQARWPELESIVAELQRDPHAAIECVVLRARIHLGQKDFAAARQLLEDLLRRQPHFLKASVILSHVFLQSGDESAAEPVLRDLVEREPTQAESWRNLAVLLRRRGRLREAIAAAQSGQLHCPDDAELRLLHAVLLREGGDWINAETCLVRLLETDRGDRRRRTTARHNLALLCRAMDRRQEAAAHWRALLVEEPDFAEARRGLAACALERIGSP